LGDEPLQAIRSVFSDRYDVLAHLGTGGMAEVYLARDLQNGRDVALKVIRQELASALGPDRFLQEIAITSRLSHENVRPLLDSGQAQGILYYTMPFVRGETLRDRLKRERRLGLQEALNVAGDLASALDYAHSRGVVHRDVKPSNIFIEHDRAVISDFGIAMALGTADADRLTKSGVLLGTAEYMAPEQCEEGEPVDGRADIYALGCVLFEMLTGQPPFTGRTRVAVMAKQVREPAPSAATLRADLPIEVEEVVRRCLAKTPADRFHTSSELRASLHHALTLWQTGGSRGNAVVHRHTSRIRTAIAAAVLFVAISLAVWAIWPPSPTLDSHKVLVYPLANRGGGAEDAGSAVAMMIGNALLHAEPLRAIDGWDYLGPAQRSDPATASLADLRSIARNRGAAYFITGGVTRRPDSISVLLTLHDTRGDSVIQQASHTGATGLLTSDQIGIRAMIELLPALIDPGREFPMAVLTERDPAAVSIWIRGDLEYRQARFTAALAHYRDAVRRDSLLVLAAVKGAQAASWAEQGQVADELSRLAEANDTILPLRFRHYVHGLRAYMDGRADEAVSRFKAALVAEPEWAEAWMALGEVYQHLLPSDLRADSSARTAFENAAALDPDFAPPLVHLSEYAVRAGDLRRAASLVARLRALGAEGAARLTATPLVVTCATRGLDPAEWKAAAQQDIDVVLEASQQLAVGGEFLPCAEAGFRSLLELPELSPNMRWAATMGLQSTLIAQNRATEAQALLDATFANGLSAALFLPPLDVLAGADLKVGAARVDSIAQARWTSSWEGAPARTMWLVGTWRAYIGDRDGLSLLRSRLHAAAQSAPDARNRIMADAIDARFTLLSDTARAIEILRGLRATGSRADLLVALYEAFPAERLLLAELLLAREMPEEAYWAAAVLDHPQPLLFTAFVPKSLALRFRAASSLSGSAWRARATEARRRLEAMGRSDLLAAAE
jgi:tetratricopeptide (TPR) repeat protein